MASDHGQLWQESGHMINGFVDEPETGTIDIFEDWRPFLLKLRETMQKFKIKMKAKNGYDQEIVRTMFFVRPQEMTYQIDGVTYEMTNETKGNFWNSKLQLLDLMRDLKEIVDPNSSIDEQSLAGAKKALVGHFKAWDKNYNKHKGKVHSELNGVIQKAFQPLIKVLESNFEFHKLELLMEKQEIPQFRFDALEDEFCKHMEALLTILTYHGKLRQEFEMKRMLNLLKVESWEESIPMHWYLQPLKEKIISVREELLEM